MVEILSDSDEYDLEVEEDPEPEEDEPEEEDPEEEPAEQHAPVPSSGDDRPIVGG